MKDDKAIRSVGIIAAVHKPNIEVVLRKVTLELERHGIAPLLQGDCAELIGREAYTVAQDDIASSDMIFALGGDGCILRAVRMAAEHGTPILGVRVGGLGFLSEVDWQDIDKAIKAILDGDHSIERRMLLRATVERDGKAIWFNYGLNDVVVLRDSFSQVQMFEVCINGEPLMVEFADGIIVATPTGSTAYSLSAGGPIVTPDAEVFVITPICAHSLYARPVVTSSSSELSIKVVTAKAMPTNVAVVIDGQLMLKLLKEDVVHVKASEHRANLVRLRKFGFLERLRQKLKWGCKDEPLFKQQAESHEQMEGKATGNAQTAED